METKTFMCNLLLCLLNIFLIFYWTIIGHIKLVGLYTSEGAVLRNNYTMHMNGQALIFAGSHNLLADLSLTAFPCATVHENLLAGTVSGDHILTIRPWFHPSQYTLLKGK